MTYQRLTTTLKATLRSRGLTYDQVAPRVGLSVSGLKKVLNGDDGSVERLLALCGVLDLELADLLALAEEKVPWRLTDEQEALFVKQPVLWGFLRSLIDEQGDLEGVREAWGLTESTADAWMAKLERRHIARCRDGRVELLDAGGRPWQASVRVGRVVVQHQQDALLSTVRASYEAGASEVPRECGLSRYVLTAEHMATLRDELRELAERWSRVSDRDRHRAPAESLHSVGLMSVMGVWSPSPM